jgi:hypothetical protein
MRLSELFVFDIDDEQTVVNDLFLFLFLQYFDSKSLYSLAQVNRQWSFVIRTLQEPLQLIHRCYHITLLFDDPELMNVLLGTNCICPVVEDDVSLSEASVMSVIDECAVIYNNIDYLVEYWIPANDNFFNNAQRVTIAYSTASNRSSNDILISSDTSTISFEIVKNKSKIQAPIDSRHLLQSKWKALLSEYIELTLTQSFTNSDTLNCPCYPLLNKLYNENSYVLKNQIALSANYNTEMELFGFSSMPLHSKVKLLEHLVQMKLIPRRKRHHYDIDRFRESGILWNIEGFNEKSLNIKHLKKHQFHPPKVSIRGSSIILQYWDFYVETGHWFDSSSVIYYQVEVTFEKPGNNSSRNIVTIDTDLTTCSTHCIQFALECIQCRMCESAVWLCLRLFS